MIFYKVEYPIPGKVEDVLAWLEKDMRLIESHYDKWEPIATFQCQREGNVVTVFHTLHEPKEISSESQAIKAETKLLQGTSFYFEVERVTDTRSLIVGSYQKDNLHIEKLFYFYLSRLGDAFNAEFKDSVTKELEVIKSRLKKESVGHWDFVGGKDLQGRGSSHSDFIPDRNEPMNENTSPEEVYPVQGISRQEVYRHLLALCNNSTNFSIAKYEDQKEEDLERLTVADLSDGKHHSAIGRIVGTVRLLPAGNDTIIHFVHKDAIWNRPVINPPLWEDFIKAVKGYFRELQRARTETVSSKQADPKDAGKIGKAKRSRAPTRKAEKRKWAKLWGFYDKYCRPQKLNAMAFRVFLENYEMFDKPTWIPQDNEVLQKLIDAGFAGEIPKYEDIEL